VFCQQPYSFSWIDTILLFLLFWGEDIKFLKDFSFYFVFGALGINLVTYFTQETYSFSWANTILFGFLFGLVNPFVNWAMK